MKRICALVLCLIVPLVTASAGEKAELTVMLSRAFERAKAPQAKSISIPVRGECATSDMRIVNASAVRETLMLRLRGRSLTRCGEVYASVRYGSSEEARAAQELVLRLVAPRSTEKLAVRAGERVSLVIREKAMTLRLPVVALGSSAVGRQIRVRDSQTHQIHVAVVTGPEEVEKTL